MSLLRQCAHRSQAAMRVYPTGTLPVASTSSARQISTASVQNARHALAERRSPEWLPPPPSLPSRRKPLMTFLDRPDTIRQATRLPHLRSMLEMAFALVQHNRLLEKPAELAELQSAIETERTKGDAGVWPSWIETEFEVMRKEWRENETEASKSYRKARSLLWAPSNLDVEALNNLIDRHAETMPEAMADHWLQQVDREEQLDTVLRPLWDALTDEGRMAARVRARYERIRSLGWRRGYSSGFPAKDGNVAGERMELLRKLAKDDDPAARQTLMEQDEKEAWEAFQAMTSLQREAEQRIAWEQRDRSLLYIDDSSTVTINGVPTVRWYATPQRDGNMVFLPKDLVRLVRNYTPPGESYDAFKATFRVPLHMHKHNVRSYLLAIYGLRTTWCRSMIYRAPRVRNTLRQVVSGPSHQTYKKVEVGLVEPFVFPEITEAFRRKHLLSKEIEAHTQRYLFKHTNRRGWRTKRNPDAPLPDPNSFALEEEIVESDDENANSLTKRNRNSLTTWNGGIPTKRHSRILRILNERYLEREAKLSAHVKKLKGEHEEES